MARQVGGQVCRRMIAEHGWERDVAGGENFLKFFLVTLPHFSDAVRMNGISGLPSKLANPGRAAAVGGRSGARSRPGSRSHWQGFLNRLEADPKIKAETVPHYGRWASGWLKTGGKDSELATRSFFDDPGRRQNLKDWQKDRGTEVFWMKRSGTRRAGCRVEASSQYRQAVSAIGLWAMEVARLEWAKAFDWKGPAAQAVELESSHRTLYRESNTVPSRSASGSGKPPPKANDHTPAPGEKEAVGELQMECQKAIRLAGMAVSRGSVENDRAVVVWKRPAPLHVMKRPGTGGPSPLDL